MRDDSSQSQAEVGITHGLAATPAKPACNQDLVGDGSGQNVAENFHNAEKFELPKPGYRTHEEERSSDKTDSHENYKPRPDSVDHCSGENSKRKACEKKPEEEPLRYLCPREAERLNEVRIKNRKTIKYDPDDEKEIQKSCKNNPPAVINAL